MHVNKRTNDAAESAERRGESSQHNDRSIDRKIQYDQDKLEMGIVGCWTPGADTAVCVRRVRIRRTFSSDSQVDVV